MYMVMRSYVSLFYFIFYNKSYYTVSHYSSKFIIKELMLLVKHTDIISYQMVSIITHR